MTHNENENDDDLAPLRPGDSDLLARATAALRDAPVPLGPDDMLLARTQTALASAALRERRRPMRTLFKFALAACLALAVGLLIFLAPPLGSHAAFAEVLQ